MSLVSRNLEAHGIPTLVIGSALDIVEHCGVARYLHSDLPLGNPCGTPYDRDMQLSIINQAITLLHSATVPNTTERTPYSWSDDNNWRDDYAKVDDSNREELARRGKERRLLQTEQKAGGIERAAMVADG